MPKILTPGSPHLSQQMHGGLDYRGQSPYYNHLPVWAGGARGGTQAVEFNDVSGQFQRAGSAPPL